LLAVAAAMTDWPVWIRALTFATAAVATVAEFFTVSRAGIPVFAFVLLGTMLGCGLFRLTLKNLAAGAFLLLGFAGVFYKSWGTLKQRYDQASLKEEYFDPQYDGRGVYFRLADAIVEDRPLGVGLNNWSYWVSKRYGARLGLKFEDYDDMNYRPSKQLLPSIAYAAPAHDLGVLTAGELGLPGLVVFSLLWMRWFQLGAQLFRRRRDSPAGRLGVGLCLGICGIFLQSFTEWVYRQSPIYYTFHILIGAVASLGYHWKTQHRVPPALPSMEPPESEWAETPLLAASGDR
jgi:hypothetical protein